MCLRLKNIKIRVYIVLALICGALLYFDFSMALLLIYWIFLYLILLAKQLIIYSFFSFFNELTVSCNLLIFSFIASNFLLKCLEIIAEHNVAVPTPDRIYPPQTNSRLFNLPKTESPNTAYPLLVNALETITNASSKFAFSVNEVKIKLKNISPNNNRMLIPNPLDSV